VCHSYARSKSTVLVIAALWLGLALIASLISIWFPIPTALSIGAGSRYYRHRGDPNDLTQHLLSEAGSSDLAKTRIPVLSKILYAHDGSEDGFRALTRALAIAKQNHAELHMVSVEKPADALIPKVARQNCCPRRHPRFKAQKRRRAVLMPQIGFWLWPRCKIGMPSRGVRKTRQPLAAGRSSHAMIVVQ
jgi:hypothetical protein